MFCTPIVKNLVDTLYMLEGDMGLTSTSSRSQDACIRIFSSDQLDSLFAASAKVHQGVPPSSVPDNMVCLPARNSGVLGYVLMWSPDGTKECYNGTRSIVDTHVAAAMCEARLMA